MSLTPTVLLLTVMYSEANSCKGGMEDLELRERMEGLCEIRTLLGHYVFFSFSVYSVAAT